MFRLQTRMQIHIHGVQMKCSAPHAPHSTWFSEQKNLMLNGVTFPFKHQTSELNGYFRSSTIANWVSLLLLKYTIIWITSYEIHTRCTLLHVQSSCFMCVYLLVFVGCLRCRYFIVRLEFKSHIYSFLLQFHSSIAWNLLFSFNIFAIFIERHGSTRISFSNRIVVNYRPWFPFLVFSSHRIKW